METPTIEFSLEEKLAIVKALDAIIQVDGVVHEGEINTLTEIMHRLDFETNFIIQARNIATKQCAIILGAMSDDKKAILASMLHEMAISDGFFHERESDMIDIILSKIEVHVVEN